MLARLPAAPGAAVSACETTMHVKQLRRLHLEPDIRENGQGAAQQGLVAAPRSVTGNADARLQPFAASRWLCSRVR